MGEEYGENAPFQFFSDHIDPDIARGHPRGPARGVRVVRGVLRSRRSPTPRTARRSSARSSRAGVTTALGRLYAELLATRARLPPGDVDAIEFDEGARWLRVRRGAFELAMNFAAEPRRVPCSRTRSRVVLATADRDRERGSDRRTSAARAAVGQRSTRCPER